MHGNKMTFTYRGDREVLIERIDIQGTYNYYLNGEYEFLSKLIRSELLDKVKKDYGTAYPVQIIDQGGKELPDYRVYVSMLSYLPKINLAGDRKMDFSILACILFLPVSDLSIESIIRELNRYMEWDVYAEDYSWDDL